jgi:hypothetical protein
MGEEGEEEEMGEEVVVVVMGEGANQRHGHRISGFMR